MISLKELLPDRIALRASALPEPPKFYVDSFLFIRSTENVNAPGELISELFRETFYPKYYSDLRVEGSRLDPDCHDLDRVEGKYVQFTEGERAILEIIRGKPKKDRGKVFYSYTPTYPQLMRNAWMRKKHGRNIRGHFIGGLLAQALWCPNHRECVKKIEELGTILFNAGIGDKSKGNQQKSEISDALMKLNNLPESDCYFDEISVQNKLKDYILGNKPEEGYNNKQIYNLHLSKKNQDLFPKQILDDFKEILSLESELPRIEWINYLANFLRITVPVWVITSTRNTSIIYDTLVNIIDNGKIPSIEEFYVTFFQRNKRIFICSETVNSGGEQDIKAYAYKRIKLSLLLYLLEDIIKDGTFKHRLNIESTSNEEIGLFELFQKVLNARFEIRRVIDIGDKTSIDSFLIRQAECYKGFRDPLKTSIFKNMAELLRVLREPDAGFDSGGLLIPTKKGREIKGYIVSPQPALIRLFTFLALKRKGSSRYVVQDLVDHFEIYGIDFSSSNEALTKLNKSLLQLGLLDGSPDAGTNAAISTPFNNHNYA